MSPTLYIAVGLIGVMVLRMVAPLWAALVGLILTTGVLVWGVRIYDAGQSLALAGVPLSLPVFLGAVGILFLFEAIHLRNALQRRRRLSVPPKADA